MPNFLSLYNKFFIFFVKFFFSFGMCKILISWLRFCFRILPLSYVNVLITICKIYFFFTVPIALFKHIVRKTIYICIYQKGKWATWQDTIEFTQIFFTFRELFLLFLLLIFFKKIHIIVTKDFKTIFF